MNKSTEITHALMDQATHAADQVAKSTQQLANGLLEGVRDTSHQLRVKAERTSDHTVRFIRHEPVKAVLIAAATGAALMALISLAKHSRDRR
ncbi:MAG: hypothetical protein PSV24_10325 [Rhodoferax sp.]|nr:hypothetical protein [Rhodoferax sp.]